MLKKLTTVESGWNFWTNLRKIKYFPNSNEQKFCVNFENKNFKSHFKYSSVHSTIHEKEWIHVSLLIHFGNVNVQCTHATIKKYNLEKCSLTVDLTNSHFSKWYDNKPAANIFLTTGNTLFCSSNCSMPSVWNAALRTTKITEKIEQEEKKN